MNFRLRVKALLRYGNQLETLEDVAIPILKALKGVESEGGIEAVQSLATEDCYLHPLDLANQMVKLEYELRFGPLV